MSAISSSLMRSGPGAGVAGGWDAFTLPGTRRARPDAAAAPSGRAASGPPQDAVAFTPTTGSPAENSSNPQPSAPPAGKADRAAAPPGTGRPRPGFGGARKLDSQQQAEVEKLQKRDRDVRQHEAAHEAAAGPYAKGGPSFTYQTGPDGQPYAVGGEVPIDLGTEKDPAATIAKMETVERAALAPADPSGQDRAVAAQAASIAEKARQEEQQPAPPAGAGTGAATAKPSAPAARSLPGGSATGTDRWAALARRSSPWVAAPPGRGGQALDVWG